LPSVCSLFAVSLLSLCFLFSVCPLFGILLSAFYLSAIIVAS
jgi:hypothetical protein